MAAVHKLPLVYVIENNQYAMGTSLARSTTDAPLCLRGEAFNVPGRKVDGMDVLAVREAATEARARAADGGGPMILEMETYRYRGHFMSDPARYRTREEIDGVRATRDPIDSVLSLLDLDDSDTDRRLNQIKRAVKAAVLDAAEYAANEPEPAPSELLTDVYRSEHRAAGLKAFFRTSREACPDRRLRRASTGPRQTILQKAVGRCEQ